MGINKSFIEFLMLNWVYVAKRLKFEIATREITFSDGVDSKIYR